MPETIKGFGTLTPLQKEFMQLLANLPDKEQFYLAGGTALSVIGYPLTWIISQARRILSCRCRIKSKLPARKEDYHSRLSAAFQHLLNYWSKGEMRV